jgi:TetR/AcrR family transcriptional repressor of nem operon
VSKGDKTRQRIVQQAAAIFNRRGFAGASLAELMEATDLEKGGIYRHFKSKEQLATEAFAYAWQQAFELRTQDLGSVANSIDQLKLLIANFVERVPAVPGGCPLMNTAIDSDDGNAALRRRARRALEQWQKLLEEIIVGGIERGEIRRVTTARKLAVLIISSLEGALAISRLEQNRAALADVREHLCDYLETQVRAPRPERLQSRGAKAVASRRAPAR